MRTTGTQSAPSTYATGKLLPGQMRYVRGWHTAVMRAVIQRVTSASVSVETETVGSLDLHDGRQGLVVLVGVTHSDTSKHSDALAEKVWRMRILNGARSASEVDAPILVISQFTLYANTAKGRRP